MDLVSRTRHVVVGFRGLNVLPNRFVQWRNLYVYGVLRDIVVRFYRYVSCPRVPSARIGSSGGPAASRRLVTRWLCKPRDSPHGGRLTVWDYTSPFASANLRLCGARGSIRYSYHISTDSACKEQRSCSGLRAGAPEFCLARHVKLDTTNRYIAQNLDIPSSEDHAVNRMRHCTYATFRGDLDLLLQ